MFLVAIFWGFLSKVSKSLVESFMCLVSWRIMFHHAKACYIYGAVGDPGEGSGAPSNF